MTREQDAEHCVCTTVSYLSITSLIGIGITTEAREAKHSFCSSWHVGMTPFHLQNAAPAPTPIRTQKMRTCSKAVDHTASCLYRRSKQKTIHSSYNLQPVLATNEWKPFLQQNNYAKLATEEKRDMKNPIRKLSDDLFSDWSTAETTQYQHGRGRPLQWVPISSCSSCTIHTNSYLLFLFLIFSYWKKTNY